MTEIKDVDIITPLKAYLDQTVPAKNAWVPLMLALQAQLRRILFKENVRLVEREAPGELHLATGICVKQERGVILVEDGIYSDRYPIQALSASLYSRIRIARQAECRKALEAFVHTTIAEQANLPVSEWKEGLTVLVGARNVLRAESILSSCILEASSRTPSLWGQKDNVQQLTSFIAKKFWELEILNKDVLGLAIRIFGFQVELRDYNYCVVHYEALKSACALMPNMAPFFRSMTDDNYMAHIGEMRKRFLANGGTRAAWRWLTRQSVKMVGFIVMLMTESDGRFVPEVISKLNYLAQEQVGVLPVVRHSWLLSWLQDQDPHYTNNLVFVLTLKRALVAFRKRKINAMELGFHLQMCVNGAIPLTSLPPKEIRRRLRNATWKSMVRRGSAHLKQRQSNSVLSPDLDREWEHGSGDITCGDFCAVSLNSGAAIQACSRSLPQYCNISAMVAQGVAGLNRVYAVYNKWGCIGLIVLQREASKKKWKLTMPQVLDIRVSRTKLLPLFKAVTKACKIPRQP